MKILVLNGPNINMLGLREPDVYGKAGFSELLQLLSQTANKLGRSLSIHKTPHKVGCPWVNESAKSNSSAFRIVKNAQRLFLVGAVFYVLCSVCHF